MRKRAEMADKNSCLNKAGDDEMVFVLLGRDPAAAAAVRYWARERVRLGKNVAGDGQLREAEQAAVLMEHQAAHHLEERLRNPLQAVREVCEVYKQEVLRRGQLHPPRLMRTLHALCRLFTPPTAAQSQAQAPEQAAPACPLDAAFERAFLAWVADTSKQSVESLLDDLKHAAREAFKAA